MMFDVRKDFSAAVGIRRAERADVSRLIEIRASVRENRLDDPGAAARRDYERFIDGPGLFVWVEDGAIGGFSGADPRDGGIWALFVAPEQEGRGVGRALLAVACARLRGAGVGVAWLTTDPGTRAERLYRRDGWICDGRLPTGELRFVKRL